MKQYHIRIFLNHKKITSCQRIAETWINCEDISRAEMYAMQYIKSEYDLSGLIFGDMGINELTWGGWHPASNEIIEKKPMISPNE